MVKRKDLTRAQIHDRILSEFSRRGWREDGEAAAIVSSLERVPGSAPKTLAASVPKSFLLNNAVARTELERAIAAALAGVRLLPRLAEGSASSPTSISIQNSGTFAGVVGGGAVGGILQAPVSPDQAAQLTERYRAEPRVAEIVNSSFPAEVRRQRIQSFLQAGLGIATDVAAKVAANLIRGS